jgi:hypothetical protein
MKKRSLVFTLFGLISFVSFISCSLAISPADFSVDVSGYDIIATNNLGYPVTLEIVYHRISSNLSINEDATIQLDVDANNTTTHTDSFATTQGCGTLFGCQIWLINYSLIEVHMPGEDFSSLIQRISDLEDGMQQHDQRLSALESWKLTIEDWKIGIENWKNAVEDTISGLGELIDELFAKTDDQESRITSLETNQDEITNWTKETDGWKNQTEIWKDQTELSLSEVNLNLTKLFTVTNDHELRIVYLENRTKKLDLWKYLSPATKQDIVCGLAIDNKLTSLKMTELGYSCTVKYNKTNYGERPTCRCWRI